MRQKGRRVLPSFGECVSFVDVYDPFLSRGLCVPRPFGQASFLPLWRCPQRILSFCLALSHYTTPRVRLSTKTRGSEEKIQEVDSIWGDSGAGLGWPCPFFSRSLMITASITALKGETHKERVQEDHLAPAHSQNLKITPKRPRFFSFQHSSQQSLQGRLYLASLAWLPPYRWHTLRIPKSRNAPLDSVLIVCV